MAVDSLVAFLRTETYALKNGAGRIAVRGNRSACGLFLDGEPFVFNWADCAGSIGQDLCYFDTYIKHESILDLAKVTAQLPSKSEPLWLLILPLLRQFPSGSYTLTLSPLIAGEQWVERYVGYEPGEEPPYLIREWEGGYYPENDGVYGGKALVATLPDEWLDEERILQFWYAIESGERPFAITAAVEGGMCEFVLDGHHKLTAYAYAKTSAWRLCITMPASPLKKEDWPTSGIPRSWHIVTSD